MVDFKTYQVCIEQRSNTSAADVHCIDVTSVNPLPPSGKCQFTIC